MTTADSGPLITFGQAVTDDFNWAAGPSAWYQGDMILDPRAPFTYQPGQSDSQPNFGWPTIGGSPILTAIPVTASTTNLVNAATPTSGTALTLPSSSVAGVTVGCSVVNALTGQTVTGLIGLDVNVTRTATATFTNGSPKISWGTAASFWGMQIGDVITFTTSGTLPTGFAIATNYYIVAIAPSVFMLSATPGGAPIVAGSAGSGTQTASYAVTNSTVPQWAPQSTQPRVVFGQGPTGVGGPQGFWNPVYAVSRALVWTTSGGSDTSGTYVAKGFDIYGYPITQTLTGVSGSTATTLKGFKYIQSLTPQGTINSTSMSVGTTDVIGLPLRTDYYGQLVVVWGTAATQTYQALAANVFTAPDIVTPSATTGDVRGTLNIGNLAGGASDGSKQLFVTWNPWAANMNSTLGLLGQPQF
jgi:hypothetical protein